MMQIIGQIIIIMMIIINAFVEEGESPVVAKLIKRRVTVEDALQDKDCYQVVLNIETSLFGPQDVWRFEPLWF